MTTSTRRWRPVTLSRATARRIWLHAQRLDTRAPFGSGPAATLAAIEHLGYVQIDTIHVIERSHHHILYTRIPDYRRADLHRAQSVDKTVFEYWTHALSYIPIRDYRFFMPEMKRHRANDEGWFGPVNAAEWRKVMRLLRENASVSIRDIDDDVLVEKNHPWASRKPSKRALQRAFFRGDAAISQRDGMVKSYALTKRHFGWDTQPRPATPRQVDAYRLDRALRAQGLVSLDSICHLAPKAKPAVRALLDARVRRRELVPVQVDGDDRTPYWAPPEILDEAARADEAPPLAHLLSPFDPVAILRRRLSALFGYDHLFEAYVPKEKRRFGYFALPVLVGDEIVAAIDLKTDREAGRLLVQQWTWVGSGNDRDHRATIEDELGRFEAFQLAD